MATISRQQFEEQSLLYGWDETLTALTASLNQTELAHLISNLASSDRDGWTFLLPNLPADAAVLCFDARFGTTAIALSEWAREVTVIHPCKTTIEIIDYRLRQSGITNVQVIHTSLATDRLPFGDAKFDSVIYHDVTGFLSKNPATADWAFSSACPSAIGEAARVLRNDGFLYYGVRNPLGFSAWKNLIRGQWRDFYDSSGQCHRVRRVQNALSSSGFGTITAHPYLLTQDHVCEVLPEDGYKSVKNSLLFRERLKELLLGRMGAQVLAPAYGIIAAKDKRLVTQINGLADNLIANHLLPTKNENPIDFLRYLILPGKAFITLGGDLPNTGNIVTVIPRYPRFIDGRRKELVIVEGLKTAAPQIRNLLPHEYRELSFSGRPIFAMSEIRGITVDRAMPAVTKLTRNALDFLVDFHKSTARSQTIDEASYAKLLGVIINQAQAAYPSLSTYIDRIDSLVKRVMMGETIVTCWLHGDFKLENLIFDRHSLAITGVIDWEHSRKEGLPWLDILYLIAYNRITEDDTDFFAVFQNSLLKQRFTAFESSLLRTYIDAIPIKPSLRPPLLAIFFLHHIAFRYKYNLSMATDRNKLLTTLALISSDLVSHSLMHGPSRSD